MHRTRGVRIERRHRVLTSVAIAVTATTAIAVAVPPAAHAAGPGATTPRLRGATVSSQHLDSAGGVVTVGATTVATKRCRLRVTPAVHRTPPTKLCKGASVSWHVRLPRNTTAKHVRYRFTLHAVGPHHRAAIDRHRSVIVAATTDPPAVTSITASDPQLEFVGGNSHIVVDAERNLRCKLSVSPAVPEPPTSRTCTHPTTSWKLAFPANPAATAVTYTVTATVTGTHHQQATASTTVVVAAHPPPCPGQTSSARPRTAAFFNDPTTRVAADQTRVVDAEINVICSAQLPTKSGPTQITLGMYIYQLDNVSQALLWAEQYMHASVHVLIDGSNKFVYAADGSVVDNPAYDSLLAGLPAGNVLLCGPNAGAALPPRDDTDDDGSGVFPAGTGCAADNIMHTKLLIVSSVDAAHDPAVFSSSQNLGNKAENAALNNGLQIVGNRSLYQLDASYFTRIERDTRQPDVGGAFSTSPISLPEATATSWFAPRNVPAAFPTNQQYIEANDEATDSVAKLLDTVDCSTPGANAGTHTGGSAHTSIRIAESAFNKRPLVTAALDKLADAGCDIQVIYTKMTDGTLSDLQAHGITPMQLNDPAYPYSDGSGSGLIFVHDKYVLISGGLQSGGSTKANQDLVLTGSANLTQRSLHRNDEASIAYQQSANGSTPVFDDYAANWERLAALVAAIPPNPPPPV